MSFLLHFHFISFDVFLSRFLEKIASTLSQEKMFALLGKILSILQLFISSLARVVLREPFWMMVHLQFEGVLAPNESERICSKYGNYAIPF